MVRFPRTAVSLLVASGVFVACSDTAQEPSTTTTTSVITETTITESISSVTSAVPPGIRSNVLLIILDDLGVDSAQCYAAAPDLAPMPHLANLCDSGLVFDRVWSNPVCSPTRATLVTGKYGFRTGIGQVVTPTDVGLRSDELTLPMALSAQGIPSANIGKWHLAGTDAVSVDTHPNEAGFEYYAGSPTGVLPNYQSWRRVVNGVAARETGYATTVTVDDALAWIGLQDGPWFAWVAFNAPHTPFHLPPGDLHSRDDLSGTTQDIAARPREYFEAMVEALDTEIDRLLTSIDRDEYAETVVIVVGDNGTAGQVVSGLSRGHAKGSVYSGGIHVPMIVAGPGVVAGRTDALVNLVDVFPTIVDVMGVEPVPAIDGVSFVDVLAGGSGTRSTLYSELFGSDQGDDAAVTVSDGRWQYIRFSNGVEELYDLASDPTEETNLVGAIDEAAALEDLRQRLAQVTG